MIKNRKSVLERRIAKLEKSFKNEQVDLNALSDSLRDSQDEISVASDNLYSKYRMFVSARPSTGGLEYEIPEEAFKSLSKAVKALDAAKELVKDARIMLDEFDY